MPSPFPPSPADRASDVLAIIDADGARFADPDAAQLTVLELAATRGDGIFETFGCHSGHPQAVDAHLARFARSARALDLPAPDLAAWRAAVLAVGSQLSPFGEATIKTVYSRGREGTPTPTGWVHGRAAPDFTRSRVEGIRVDHPGPRIPTRHRPDGPVAARRSQDTLVRREHRRASRGNTTGSG